MFFAKREKCVSVKNNDINITLLQENCTLKDFLPLEAERLQLNSLMTYVFAKKLAS